MPKFGTRRVKPPKASYMKKVVKANNKRNTVRTKVPQKYIPGVSKKG